ncbi:MAG: hypothetical protein HY905_11485 [Deltaproteobacteria bacterium]|nr:hypothetical protein [Deltaproteobacteria bacterium]
MTRRTLTVGVIAAMAWASHGCGILAGADDGDVGVPDADDGGPDAAPDASGDGGVTCDAAELGRRLEQARAGETVTIGACRVAGTFEVPAGVTLAGQGEATVLETPGDAFRPVLTLRTGRGATTRVTDLRIESASNYGIAAIGGGGAIEADRVTVVATRGVAIGVERTASLKLTTVELEGPFAAGGTTRPEEARPESMATHGLVVVRGGRAELDGVRVRGFAGFGVVLVGTTTVWTGGGAPDNLGVGLAVSAGDTTLAGVDLSRSHWLGGPLIGEPGGGEDGLPPSFGGVFVDGAIVHSTDLVVSGGEGFGLVHDGGTVRHERLAAHGNGRAGLWAQGTQSLEVTGAGTSLRGNRYAGIVVVDPVSLTIRDAAVETTRWGCLDCGALAERRAADGIQVVRPQAGATLADLVLHDNARIGLLLDLGGGTMDGVSISGIDVYGTGEELGAVAQNGEVAGAWDAGITRGGGTGLTDYDPGLGILSVAGRISIRVLPAVGDLDRTGLRGLIDPDPPY